MTTNLSLKTSLGYGVGGVGANTANCLFYGFFLFFLTTVGGIDPAIGGVICFVGVSWASITHPLIGYGSDNYRSKYGRRRPFIIAFSVPLGITTALMYTDLSFFNDTEKTIYFLLLNIVFWLFVGAVDIPHISLGSELTDDYNERTRLRTVTTVFMTIGELFTFTMPLLLANTLADVLGSESAGWSAMGICFGFIVAISYFISWVATKGREKTLDFGKLLKRKNPFKEFIDVYRNKTVKHLVVASFLINAATSGIAASVIVFFGRYNLGFDDLGISAIFLAYGLSNMLFTPVVGFISTKYSHVLGKGKVMALSSIFSGVMAIGVKLIGINSISIYVVCLFFGLGQAAYWTLIFSMAYDVALVDEFKTGEKREGIIIAFISFFIKVGTALGIWISGVGLKIISFDGAALTQKASVLKGIEVILVFLPAFLLIVAGLVLLRYPISQKIYEEIKEAVRLKNAGEKYSQEEFAHLI